MENKIEYSSSSTRVEAKRCMAVITDSDDTRLGVGYGSTNEVARCNALSNKKEREGRPQTVGATK